MWEREISFATSEETMLARTLAATALALALATPALAQGPLSPPNDSGPSATDYTGYTVLYLINGVRRHTPNGQGTQIVCTNLGQEDVHWAVQVFDGTGSPTLVCETTASTPSDPGENDTFTTGSLHDNFGLAGTCPNGNTTTQIGTARMIVEEKKAALLCTARAIDDVTRNVVADLPVLPLGKPPKLKIK
jgi:hypothetical protein